MRNQPEICERCGAALQIDGEYCYQNACDYGKKPVDDYDDYDGFDGFERNEDNNLNHYFRKKEAEEEQDNSNENDFDQEGSERSLVDNNDNDSDGGGLFEGVGDGCIFGFFKLIWKIISFPFKVILRIIEIFD